VAKLAYAPDLGSGGVTRGGSSPPIRTKIQSFFGEALEVLIHSLTDVEHEMEIVVQQEELRTHFDKAYREHAKKITMPGFRPGRVPMQMIKRLYGQMIEAEVIEKLANDFFKNALEERNIQAYGTPVLQAIDMKPELPVSIKIKYEPAPDIVAKDYTGMQLERLQHDVTDEEVEDEIRDLLRSRKQLDEVEQADDENYRVTCEIQMLTPEGMPIEGQKNDNFVVDLDEAQLNRDLKAELLNMKTGEEKDVELSHEGQDGQDETERAHLKIKKVEKITLQDLTDAFVKDVTQGRLETVDALREDIRTTLVQHWKQRYDQLFENELRNELIKRNPFPVPAAMIENMKNEYVNHLRDRQPEKKLPDNFNIDEYKKTIENEIVTMTKWMFIRDSILKQENITLSDEDVLAKAEEEAAKLHIDKERLIQYFKSDSAFSNEMLNEKFQKFLLENNEVKLLNDDDISHTPLTPFAELPNLHNHDHHDHDHDHHNHDHDNEDKEEETV
jgi:trigger factor